MIHALSILLITSAGLPAALRAQETVPQTARDIEPPAARVSLIDAQLARSEAIVVGVTPTQLIAIIAGGPQRATDAEGWIGFTSPLTPATGSPSLTLTDGQRFIGAPLGGAGDLIRWRAEGAATVEATLEQIDRIVLVPNLDPGPLDALEDVIILTNGDRLEGFVAELSDTISIEVEGRTIDLPLERAAIIDLANPPEERSGAYMWFEDGSTARLRIEGDEYRLAAAPSGWEAPAPLNRARAFIYDAAAVTALSELDLVSSEPIGRRWAPPPQIRAEPAGLWAAPVSLPGPMRVTWSLPEGAVRFGAIIELREDSRIWGDCDVVISQRRAIGGQGHLAPLARAQLDSAHPRAEVAVDLDPGVGGELIITIEPGPSGPIQDRVQIDGALILLGAAGS